MTWREIPAFRVLEISEHERRNEFDELNAAGDPVRPGERTELFVRRRDQRVFRFATLQLRELCFRVLEVRPGNEVSVTLEQRIWLTEV